MPACPVRTSHQRSHISTASLFKGLFVLLALLAGARVTAASAQSLFSNGVGLNFPSAVWGKRPAPSAPSVYQLQPDRWSPGLLARTRASGFGFIRLVTTPVPLMTDDPAAQARALAWVSGLVDQANAAGLSVIVDFHPWPTDLPASQDTMAPDSAQRAALIRAQKRVAAMLVGKPAGRVALELLNEPPCYAGPGGPTVDWPAIQREMVRQVRTVAPRLPLVLTGCRGLPDRLTKVDPSPYKGDPQIYWTFHYYQPSIFVGQQPGGMLDVPFPPDPKLAASPSALLAMLPPVAAAKRPRTLVELRAYLTQNHGEATISADFDAVSAWARRNGIAVSHIFVGEFGTSLTSDNPSAARVRPSELRWLAAVRRQSKSHGFAWAYWVLPGPKSLNYDPGTGFINAQTLSAFGLAAAK